MEGWEDCAVWDLGDMGTWEEGVIRARSAVRGERGCLARMGPVYMCVGLAGCSHLARMGGGQAGMRGGGRRGDGVLGFAQVRWVRGRRTRDARVSLLH